MQQHRVVWSFLTFSEFKHTLVFLEHEIRSSFFQESQAQTDITHPCSRHLIDIQSIASWIAVFYLLLDVYCLCGIPLDSSQSSSDRHFRNQRPWLLSLPSLLHAQVKTGSHNACGKLIFHSRRLHTAMKGSLVCGITELQRGSFTLFHNAKYIKLRVSPSPIESRVNAPISTLNLAATFFQTLTDDFSMCDKWIEALSLSFFRVFPVRAAWNFSKAASLYLAKQYYS